MAASPGSYAPPTTMAELIRSRRTIHDFRPGTPSDSIILEAIESARWAPNHRLTEPWHFYLVGPVAAAAISELNSDIARVDRGEQAARAKLQRWLAMPGWIAVTCNRSADEIRRREDFAACCCAIQNLSLHLWSKGIGMKWGTGPVTRDPRFYDLLGADIDSEEVVGLFWYGYPATLPEGHRTRSVEQIVRTLE